MSKKDIASWEKETQKLAELFNKKYFDEDSEMFWVADEIGGVLCINGYFFNQTDIVDYLRYDYKTDKMFAHYDYTMECHEKKERPVNIKNFRHLKS